MELADARSLLPQTQQALRQRPVAAVVEQGRAPAASGSGVGRGAPHRQSLGAARSRPWGTSASRPQAGTAASSQLEAVAALIRQQCGQQLSRQVVGNYLRRLVRSVPRKIFFIVDLHSVHRAHQVQQWVAQHADQIELFYLPPYSPELNPDECLNQDI